MDALRFAQADGAQACAARTRLRREPELVWPIDMQEAHHQLELYLHFTDANDRDLVEGLGNLLVEEGYVVVGIQLVNKAITAGDIRYRHEDQEKQVEQIKLISEEYFSQNLKNESIILEILDISERYPNLPRNRIELWLPQL